MNKSRHEKFLIVFSLLLSYLVNAKEEQEFELDFTTVNYQQWQETLSKNKGTVLVVDMWATWCISCLERFPHMVEMDNKYQSNGVKFVSLLLEDPEELEAIEMAKKFLVKQKAKFKHYFMNENLMYSFDKLNLLGIPAVFIYNKNGELIHRLTGDNPNKQFTEKDIEVAINELITK